MIVKCDVNDCKYWKRDTGVCGEVGRCTLDEITISEDYEGLVCENYKRREEDE